MKKMEYDAIIDVFENLLKEEKRGRQYFKDAAKIVTQLSARQLLEKLALAEEEHINVLLVEKELMEQLKDGIYRDEAASQQFTFDVGEIPGFDVQEEIRDVSIPILNLFKSGDMKRFFEQCSVEDVIALAQKIETDNFNYLVAAAKKMVTRPAFERLIKLANEEKEHFLWLQRIQKYSTSRGAVAPSLETPAAWVDREA